VAKVRDARLQAALTEAVAAERERILAELKRLRLLKVPGVQRDAFDEAIQVVKGKPQP
jgi:hypothetical protein